MATSYLGPQAAVEAYRPGKNFQIVSGFPFRNNGRDPHAGVDWAAANGTPIGAATDGVVHYVEPLNATAGNWIVLKHTRQDGSFFYTSYMHMQSASPLAAGQTVNAGQTIGYVGSTGRSEGPHLHFEVTPQGQNPLTRGHLTIDPLSFSSWGNAPHMIGTDSTGNPLISQTLTSAFDGSSFTTITTKSPAGVVLGSSQTSTLDLQDGGGNSIGTRTVYNTYGSYGSSQVVTVSGLNGNLVQRTTTQTNGDVFQERAGLRFQTINGVTSASVDGLAVPMTTQPDGSYNLATSSGNLNVKLNADPFAGGVITAAGQTFQFSGNDTLFVGNGGLWVQGAPTNDVNFPGEFNMRLIDATGSGTQFNYETKPPSLREGGFGIDSESQMSWQLTETILIGANASGAITDSFTLDTNASTLAGQNSNVIDLSAGSGEGNNLFAGIQLTGALASLDAAIKAEISKIASEGQNTWAAEAHDAWLINTAYTPSSGIAVLANSVAMPLSQNVFNETWGSTNDAVINTVIAQTLLEDASQQLALTQTWQLAAVDLANLGKH
jgi:hypothetical protein